jgi:hypothetical protein
VPKALQTPPFFRALAADDERGNQATTIFPPDNRMVFPTHRSRGVASVASTARAGSEAA